MINGYKYFINKMNSFVTWLDILGTDEVQEDLKHLGTGD